MTAAITGSLALLTRARIRQPPPQGLPTPPYAPASLFDRVGAANGSHGRAPGLWITNATESTVGYVGIEVDGALLAAMGYQAGEDRARWPPWRFDASSAV